jgi:zinc transport system permease protein
MLVPVAVAQQVIRGFKTTMLLAMAIGVLSAVSGLVGSFPVQRPARSPIVLLAMTVFLVTVIAGILTRPRRAPDGREIEVAR